MLFPPKTGGRLNSFRIGGERVAYAIAVLARTDDPIPFAQPFMGIKASGQRDGARKQPSPSGPEWREIGALSHAV